MLTLKPTSMVRMVQVTGAFNPDTVRYMTTVALTRLVKARINRALTSNLLDPG